MVEDLVRPAVGLDWVVDLETRAFTDVSPQACHTLAGVCGER